MARLDRSVALLLVIVAMVAGARVVRAAPAPVRSYADAKLTVAFPADWAIKDGANGVTFVGGPKAEADIMVFPVKAPTPDGVKKAVDEQITAMHATAVTWDGALTQTTVNGLDAFARKGMGMIGGKPHSLVTLLVMNGKNGVVFVSIVLDDRKETYRDALTATVMSIKPSK